MKFPVKLRARLQRRLGQSMVEYTLVLAGLAMVTMLTGYQHVGTIIVTSVNSVVALF